MDRVRLFGKSAEQLLIRFSVLVLEHVRARSADNGFECVAQKRLAAARLSVKHAVGMCFDTHTHTHRIFVRSTNPSLAWPSRRIRATQSNALIGALNGKSN